MFPVLVLHLMNRLHLPPPFGDCELFPGNLRVVSEESVTYRTTVQQPSEASTNVPPSEEAMELTESSESELSSSDEEHKLSVAPPQRRQSVQRREQKSLHTLCNPRLRKLDATKTTATPASLNEVFETPAQSSKLNIHLPEHLPSLGTKDKPVKHERVGGFGVIQTPAPAKMLQLQQHPPAPQNVDLYSEMTATDEFQLRKFQQQIEPAGGRTVESESTEDDEEEQPSVLPSFSLNELHVRRLTVEERANYTVFSQNSSPGCPASRLYIKNLAPSVTEADLYRVFGVFQFGPVNDLNFAPPVPSSPTERFSIRLLTAGRMKGQAFVGLSCETTAAQALEATNGLLLHDRPIVVQFARGAKAKVDQNSLIANN